VWPQNVSNLKQWHGRRMDGENGVGVECLGSTPWNETSVQPDRAGWVEAAQ